MKKVILKLLGLDFSPEETAGAEWRVQFQALPQGAWAMLAIAAAIVAVAVVWWLYRKEGRELSLALRLVAASLRLAILACVAFMLLEVVIVLVRKEYNPSRLLVLLDTSESMGLQDPFTEEAAGAAVASRLKMLNEDGKADLDALRKQTRIELAQKAIGDVSGKLADGRVVAGYGFSTSIVPQAELDELNSLKATGLATGIGDAVKNVLAANRGQKLAGILLVTDGQSNAGEDAVKVAQGAGKEGVPIVSIAVGTAEGPRNARLAEIDSSPAVFVRDPVEIGVVVESRGLKGQTASVILEISRDGGGWEEIGRETPVLGEDAVLQRFNFRYTPESTGQLDVRAQVQDVGPELTTSDNIATKSIRVIRQKIRVLLIAGGPSPEVQFLRNALLRDNALEFASWLQPAGEGYEHVGHRPIRRLPNVQEELDRFDVIVLFDPDMRKLGPLWPELITKFVGNAGGGLIFVAGEQYSQQLFSPGSGDESSAVIDNSWVKVLPVVRDPGLYQTDAEVRLSSRETYTFELTPEGTDDQIFQFVPDRSRNREVLTSLPGMYWHFPVSRAKPGATVLARHGDPRMTNSFGRHVLMATQLYGPGRTVFIGFDSTYRWRYLSEDYFDGFWARLVDRVGRSKLLGGRHPFTLATDKSAYRVGDRVTVTARFINQQDAAAAIGGLTGEFEIGGGSAQPFALEPSTEEPGAFTANFIVADAGPGLIRIMPTAETDTESAGPRAATLPFRVEPARQEIDHPTVNRTMLDELARASGGQTFTLAELDQVPAAFKIKQVESVLESRKEIWNAPAIYGLLMLLLTAEWIVRKHFRMA